VTDTATTIDVCPAAELEPGDSRIVETEGRKFGVFNAGGDLYAIEDRCSHDDGPLCEGDWDEDLCRVICPRHGSAFDLATGTPRSLPATEPVATYPVRVVGGTIVLELP
jgi:3-phenylpropionate/trans-cinnamate dioxygenase ferredoxin subunit